MQRTVSIPIGCDVSLMRTLEYCSVAYQRAIDVGFKNKIRNKIKLQNTIYHEFRRDYPELPSVLVQTSCHRASENLKTAKFKTKPKSIALCARYSKLTFTMYNAEGEISLSTVDGRKRFKIQLSDWAKERYAGWIVQAVTVTYSEKQKSIILHLILSTPTPDRIPTKNVLGVDLGIVNTAVCSDNTFFNSKHLRNIKGRYQHLRGELQAKGTRSAKRKLKKISGRERRFVRDVNHCISKAIVNSSFDTFVLEDLSKIRKKSGRKSNAYKKLRKMIGGWSFYELQQMIEYKTEVLGKNVLYVNPAYTSIECSDCGFTDEDNRKDRETFHCLKCGFELNADLNASRNIANRGKLLIAGCSQPPECSDLARSVTSSHLNAVSS